MLTISKPITDQHLFAFPAKYLILVDAKNYESLLEAVEKCEIFPMSEVTIATFLSDSYVRLYKPYKISEGTDLILETCGNWSKNDGMYNLCEELKIERRHNFEKYEIKISVVVKSNESINIKNFEDLLEVTGDEPYFFNDIANIYGLMQYINATFTLRPFQSYGYLNTTTGRFSGMMGDIIEGKSDITGTFTDSSTYSGRIIIVLLFTAFMFLYVAYSAYILVLLQSTTPITSIHDLVDSRIECGGLNISFYETYYKSTKDTDLKNLYQKKLSGRYFSMEKGLDAVKEGNFAFHVGLGAAYNYILKKFSNYDICKLQELPGYLNDKLLMKVHESGLETRTKHRLTRKPKCYNEAGNSNRCESTTVNLFSFCTV
nr:unnamed protein product [Callosobruchus chinensis]